ncbi:MAG TPA: PA domain-containing protein [Actinomycetota bacterium]|nr:PA domain-containing protein [Actinomycetota bacterium]
MGKRYLTLAVVFALAMSIGGVAHAHDPDDIDSGDDISEFLSHQHGGTGGHLPATSQNVELVGKLRVHDAAPGIIADVGEFGNFAYLNQFSPGCAADGAGGTYVVDISNPANPVEVGFLPAHAGSYPGEGNQVIHVDTASFAGEILAVNNEICGAGGVGGFDLWDVTNPLSPVLLARGAGDTDEGAHPARQYHSVFIWQQAGKAYLVGSDDEETPFTDIDIFDISDPTNPQLISETGLLKDLDPVAVGPYGNGTTNFNHDMVVRKIGNTWTLLSSYWDAGYMEFNVNDPAHPKFLGDTDFTDPDPEFPTFSPAEGNAHYAEFDRKGRVFIGTDEDFSPYRTRFEVLSGPAAGQYPAGEFGFTQPIATLADQKLNGPTVFGGYGCNDDVASIPPPSVLGPLAPGEEAIVVFQRGPVQDPNHPHGACRFDEKIQNGANAGYGGVIVANHHTGSGGGAFPDAFTCGGGNPRSIPAICIGHRSMHLMFGTTPNYSVPYPSPAPDEPTPGTLGPDVQAQTAFDGWGYIHLYDANTLKEMDTYAVPEAKNSAYATGFGALSIHEVTFSRNRDLAYLSWYDAGFRVVDFSTGQLQEVGRFIDTGGNDFWGVQLHKAPDGTELVLASDRDSGLYIFRYTG